MKNKKLLVIILLVVLSLTGYEAYSIIQKENNNKSDNTKIEDKKDIDVFSRQSYLQKALKSNTNIIQGNVEKKDEKYMINGLEIKTNSNLDSFVGKEVVAIGVKEYDTLILSTIHDATEITQKEKDMLKDQENENQETNNSLTYAVNNNQPNKSNTKEDNNQNISNNTGVVDNNINDSNQSENNKNNDSNDNVVNLNLGTINLGDTSEGENTSSNTENNNSTTNTNTQNSGSSTTNQNTSTSNTSSNNSSSTNNNSTSSNSTSSNKSQTLNGVLTKSGGNYNLMGWDLKGSSDLSKYVNKMVVVQGTTTDNPYELKVESIKMDQQSIDNSLFDISGTLKRDSGDIYTLGDYKIKTSEDLSSYLNKVVMATVNKVGNDDEYTVNLIRIENSFLLQGILKETSEKNTDIQDSDDRHYLIGSYNIHSEVDLSSYVDKAVSMLVAKGQHGGLTTDYNVTYIKMK